MDGYSEKTHFGIFISAAIGCFSALVLAALLMLALSFLLLANDDPMDYVWVGGAIMLFCAAFAGFIALKSAGKAAFPCGLVCGGMYTAVVLCSALAFYDGIVWWYAPVSLACSLIGAFTGNIKGDKKAKIPSFDDKKYNFDK